MIQDIKILNNENINKKEFNHIITNELLNLLIVLHREFEGKRQQLLKDRIKIQSSIVSNYLESNNFGENDSGGNKSIKLKRPSETFEIRNDLNWKIREIPEILKDRKVDIVCLDVSDYETLKKCVQSKANGVQVDFDDGYSPSWLNNLKAQKNINDIVNDPSLNSKDSSLLLVRPRSLNLDEMHILVDGKPLSGSIFDLATFLYHNSKKLIEYGRGPFFYIPKIENYKEAIFWNDLLVRCEQLLSITPFTCKAIVLIENVLATYQMEEIIYYLRDYIIALNTGRWDYIFSYIKKLSEFPQYNVPSKSNLGLNQEFLNSYYRLLVMVSHRRGCLATGGMAPQCPSNPLTGNLSDKELLSVFNGKKDEAKMGFDGALVAHFSAVNSCRNAFKEVIGNTHLNHLTNFRLLNYSPLESANYYSKILETCKSQTLNDQFIPSVSINDVKSCLKVLYIYIYNWVFNHKGAVNIDGVVEDLATCEINRVLLWKWLKYGAQVKEENNKSLNIDMILKLLNNSQSLINNNQHHSTIVKIIIIFLTTNQLIDFIPSLLYPYILNLNLLSKQ